MFEKRYPGHSSFFQVRNVHIGKGFTIIAGPCAVESEQALLELAALLNNGAGLLRGGIFKARTSPYSFRGLGEKGLAILEKARENYDLPVMVEFLDQEQISLYAEKVDIVQIGARNMFNYPLLRAAALSGKPILLKRHFSATLDELLYAAEYILELDNPNLVLCERGIRTYETRYRNCLDLSAVVLLKQITHLPVVVDPSHAAGDSSMVEKLALASVCAGTDGLMLEVHDNPIKALSDAPQAITSGQFSQLKVKIERIKSFLL